MPRELSQLDIVGDVMLAEGTEAKVVTCVDDRSRFCVIGALNATGGLEEIARVAARTAVPHRSRRFRPA